MYVVLDTEFVWERSYYAYLGLVQVAVSPGFPRTLLPYKPPCLMKFRNESIDRNDYMLLDPLKCSPKALGSVIADGSIIKVLHDAVQDLQHLYRWSGALPANIFDTRIGAGFVGMSSTISLKNLLLETQGIDLPKAETRSNWMKRPLSEEQLEYSVHDVIYLGRAMEIIIDKARKLDTYSWMMEEMEDLNDPDKYIEDDVADAWKNLRLPQRTLANPQHLAQLRELAMWRERLARAKNLPRGWIVADKVLISSVIEPPTDFKTFTNRELPKAFADEFFSILNSIGRNVEAYNFETYKSPTPEQRRKSKLMMAEATEYAKKIHLDPAIVASRADYTAYCKNPDDPDNPFAKGWRKDVFSDVLNKHI